MTIRKENKQFLSPSSVVKITTGTEEKNENLSCFTTEVKMRFKKKNNTILSVVVIIRGSKNNDN